jgi:hypothetical protein
MADVPEIQEQFPPSRIRLPSLLTMGYAHRTQR